MKAFWENAVLISALIGIWQATSGSEKSPAMESVKKATRSPFKSNKMQQFKKISNKTEQNVRHIALPDGT